MKIFRKFKQSFAHAFNLNTLVKTHLAVQQYRQYALEGDETGVDANSAVIVSLTTYNKRIFDVYLTIESLLRQTVKPSRLLLWLSEEEFMRADLPLVLKKQQQRGLEIRFCKDIRSFKKLIPALNEAPDRTIITVDDDYIYPFDFIERLVNTSRKNLHCVCYYTGSRIGFTPQGDLKPYVQWEHTDQEYNASLLNFATGAGGVLYPPHCFYRDVLNEKRFMLYTPSADDVWFKAMTLLNGTKYVKVPLECDFSEKFISLNNAQDIALYHRNVGQGQNDLQIKAVFDRYHLVKCLQNMDVNELSKDKKLNMVNKGGVICLYERIYHHQSGNYKYRRAQTKILGHPNAEYNAIYSAI